MSFTLFDFAFVRGLVAGFALAAPVGPVAVLCIRRAISVGRLRAFIAGLGAAVADMIFGAVAGLGISAVTTFVLDHEIAIGFTGGFIVFAVGVGTFRTPVARAGGNTVQESIRGDFVVTFSLAITNPATMIAAAGIFAVFAPIDMYTAPTTASMLVVGVLVGSAVWWLILSGLAGTFREAFLERGLPHLNHISGAIIALSGAGVLIAVVTKFTQQI
jgi:threonine/homoserine/homoserine lactone efflux protein